MHGSDLIYGVMPVVILLALFVIITLPFAAASGSGDLQIFSREQWGDHAPYRQRVAVLTMLLTPHQSGPGLAAS
jgi:hypothetical protein